MAGASSDRTLRAQSRVDEKRLSYATFARLHDRINAWGPARTFLLVFTSLLALYLVTMARFDFESSTDTVASALPAWRFALFGDMDLGAFDQFPWIDEINGSVISNRAPGIAFIATPMYWLFGSAEYAGVIPSMLPATATAAILTAAAVAVLHLCFRELVDPAMAVGGALVFGLATSTWSISANELWPHGPAQFFLALALLGLMKQRFLAAGFAYGAALLIRPVTAVIAAVSGLYLGWRQRSWTPVIRVGLGTAAGLVVLVVYNQLVLGTWSLFPPSYGQSFINRAERQSILAYLGDVVGMLAHPKYGLLIFTPFLLLILPGMRDGWKQSDPWVKAGALAGLVYMLVHLRLNRFSGGLLYGYRYPLEMLTVAAPFLLLSWKALYTRAVPLVRQVFWIAVGLSVARQAYSIWVGFENPWLV